MSVSAVNLDEVSRPNRRRGFALPRVAKGIVVTLPRVVGSILLWAASLKAWDESGVVRVLEFDRVPQPLIHPAVSVVIVVECALGLLLILRPGLRGVLTATVVLLMAYTTQLVYLAAYADAPSCTCLGAWKAYRAARFDNVMGVGRNICLTLALLWVRAQHVARVCNPCPDDTG